MGFFQGKYLEYLEYLRKCLNPERVAKLTMSPLHFEKDSKATIDICLKI